MSKAPKICIVTAGCVSSAPRVEKEADALSRAGYEVHVIAVHSAAWMRRWDQAVVNGQAWKLHALAYDWGSFFGGLNRLRWGAWNRLAREKLQGEHVLKQPLRRALLRCSADLYIVHHPSLLPAAHSAAVTCGAKLASDIEDDLSGTVETGRPIPPSLVAIQALEKKFLPLCAYTTAASPGMAESIVRRYGVPPPATDS